MKNKAATPIKKTKPYPKQEEVIVFGFGHIPREGVPEIKIRYNRSTRKPFLGKITRSKDIAEFLRKIYGRGNIELQEHFIVLYLNRAYDILGYYKHAVGGIHEIAVDIRLIMATALSSASTAIVIAHNHPSGNLKPSHEDINLTRAVKKAAEAQGIKLLDHMIVTKTGFYSFSDQSLLGLNGLEGTSNSADAFVRKVETDLKNRVKHTKLSIEKLAFTYGITNRTEIKELTELAIVNMARDIAHGIGSIRGKFDKIVDLYNNQVNLSHRTSISVLLQQYSTPAPIGYLAGIFTNADDPAVSVFEPSAGNGLLTVAADPKNVWVNEVDPLRRSNLEKQGFAKVFGLDASQDFELNQGYPTAFDGKRFDAVITNPPFGKLDDPIKFGTFPISRLEHVMSIRALDLMKDDGKAAIIVGGHTKWDERGQIKPLNERIFFNYLHHHYYVRDVINIEGKKLYTRQGTGFPVRLILIAGRKPIPNGAAPLYSADIRKVVTSFEELFLRVMHHTKLNVKRNMKWKELEAEALKLQSLLENFELGEVKTNGGIGELEGPYQSVSDACYVLDTLVPDAMDFEMHQALKEVQKAIGGSMDDFVQQRLAYATNEELCEALAAEQIDAVGMAIYNIEARGQSFINGDQTGIGKGRTAAAMIRYGVNRGLKPIFITEKASLFSDFYRDLKAINSGNLNPFIINSRGDTSSIKDESGEIVYMAPDKAIQDKIIKSGNIPAKYDFIMATYTQFNSLQRMSKRVFLERMAGGNLLVLDESHNATGTGNTGTLFREVVKRCLGVYFLSATWSKEPGTMPIYAAKTVMSEANMTSEQMINAIYAGGVPLQEVLTSQLVKEGQMMRRERSNEGVKVNYITLEEKAAEHRAIADNITGVMREIIAFQSEHIKPMIEAMDEIAKKEGMQAMIREGTNQAGVDNKPYYSKVFQVINQMLFSIKAEATAEQAIRRLKEGYKPVIAFSSTMGSFVEGMENDDGIPVSEGDIIKADFAEILRKGLNGVLRYTVLDIDGKPTHEVFTPEHLPIDAKLHYYRILGVIDEISTGITLSPIDVIIQRIEEAGYSVAEVTGRRLKLQLNFQNGMGRVLNRKKINPHDAYRKFNDHETDVLLINQSGSTGASAHAIPTDKVPPAEVKPRVMIEPQFELDINTEVQKRGRIHRTGQIYKPEYDILSSAIPAEQRLMMFLQRKLAWLDANTTSNQKQSKNIFDVPDFLNKYGNKVVTEYLIENPKLNRLLDDPLDVLGKEFDNTPSKPGAAHVVSGRVAVLPTEQQEQFYRDVLQRYTEWVEYLKQIDEYDLEVEALNLEAETIDSRVMIAGKHEGASAFSEDTILETVQANVLRKPFTSSELNNLLHRSLQGRDPKEIQQEMLRELEIYSNNRIEAESAEIEERFDRQIKVVNENPKLQKIRDKEGEAAFAKALDEHFDNLREEKEKSLKHLKSRINGTKNYLEGLIEFFYTGKLLKYTLTTFNEGVIQVPAVFVGFVIDKNKSNPYAPSGIKLRFAIAGSHKYLVLAGSQSAEIQNFKGSSMKVPDHSLAEVLDIWEKAVKESTVDRSIRFIITGNILQGAGLREGKLISYTTNDGQIKKGILLPEYWQPPKGEAAVVTIPARRAVSFIKSLPVGKMLTTNSRVSIYRDHQEYRIISPASRNKAGDFFINEEVLKLVNGNNFEKRGDKMVAHLPLENIDWFVDVLQNEFNASIEISSHRFREVAQAHSQAKRFPPILDSPVLIQAPVIIPQKALPELDILELEAMALELELELLEFDVV